ncbi:hypothetical protein M3591_08540 [Exiguobacterium sp. MER 193]|uniref:hypothetical protein n=1 Tax=Exiguobacterium sp. MER 193 TaxID=2939564 RepID=UPI002040D310|nr:hypothetical protein [Exiguobacterium sp. MER 193]MCM3280581.1 hypothetical protein [Exiguobacterium sp. MER 193]
MNFDETNVEHLHIQSFQTMDLFTLKHGYLSRLPAGSYRVTDYCELDVMVTKSQLGRLRYIDLTLPLGVYIEDRLLFLYDPYRREIYSTHERVDYPNKQNISTVDFLCANSRDFHDPDSYSLKSEDLYKLPSDSHWREFGLPKVKSSATFLLRLFKSLNVSSFQTVSKKNRFLFRLIECIDETKCEYSVEHYGKWMWSNEYMRTCHLPNVSEGELLQLITMIEESDELEGFRFLIETEASILSLFILGNLKRGDAVGVFQYEIN